MKSTRRLMLASLLALFSTQAISAATRVGATMTDRQAARAAGRDEGLGQLKRYVEELMRRLPVVPGLAVAVVRGDRIIFTAGFGLRDVKAGLPVTPQTAFYIASTTKSFTGTAAKMLAAEGKLDLDVPIKTYFPNLVLKPPLSTEQLSLRDLLTHRSGINNEPIVFRTAYTGQYDAETILGLLSNHSSAVSPIFRYSNLGYIIAAYAMEKAAGESWQRIIERRILEPLGMTATSGYASKIKASADYAHPYLAESGTFTELPYKQDNTMHAAGGMASSAEDLAKWLIVNMNEGRYEGKQVIPAAALEEILSPQIDQKRSFYKFERYAYSLGWNIGTYEGEKLIHCFGEFPGFRPHVSFMPAQKIGVVVLANESRDAFLLPDLIACDIYDHLLRKQPLRVASNPKVEEFAANLQKSREERAAKAAAKESGREKGMPALPLSAYAGVYQHPEYGQIKIEVDQGSLVASFGNLSAKLRYYGREAFDAAFIPGQDFKLVFQAEQPKGVTGVNMMGKVFTRLAPS